MADYSETDIKLDRDLAVVKTKVEAIQADITDIKAILKDLKNSYVTKEEFEPIKRGFYGLIGAVVVEAIGIIGAVVVWLLTR